MKKIAIKLYYSTIYSINGLLHTFKHELAFRLEIFASIFLIPLAIYIAQNINQLLWMLLTLFLVLIVELGNTAIEATVDRIGTEQHPLSMQAKDAASAAVLCSLLFTAIVWGMIIYSNFM